MSLCWLLCTNFMWCDLGKSVWSLTCDIFSFLFDWSTHLDRYILLNTSPELDLWFQSYEQLKDCVNNRKQKKINLCFWSYLTVNTPNFRLILLDHSTKTAFPMLRKNKKFPVPILPHSAFSCTSFNVLIGSLDRIIRIYLFIFYLPTSLRHWIYLYTILHSCEKHYLKVLVPIHSLSPNFFQIYGDFGTKSWVIFRRPYVWNLMRKLDVV